MADFDKISINGTYYNVKDSALTAAVNALTSEVGDVQETVTQQGQQITQHGQAIQNLESSALYPGNVKKYGAVGDGVTDDTEAFKNALADNPAIFVPTGTYIVSGIDIPEYRNILGESDFSSVIKLKDGANRSLLKNTGAGSVHLDHLYLDGNRDNNTSGSCVEFEGHFFTLTDVQAWNAASNGFTISGSGTGSLTDGTLTTLTRCAAKHNGGHGYYIEENDAQLTNCEATANSQSATNNYDGIHAQSACKVIGCHVWGSDNGKSHRYAIWLNNSSIVQGCHIEGAETNNLFVSGYGNMITGCMIYALIPTTNANDVWFQNGDNVISDCVINSPNGPNNAIGIGGNATRISVINCDITAYRAINNYQSAGGNIFIFVGGKGGNSSGTQVVNNQLNNDVYIVLGNWDSGKLINNNQW